MVNAGGRGSPAVKFPAARLPERPLSNADRSTPPEAPPSCPGPEGLAVRLASAARDVGGPGAEEAVRSSPLFRVLADGAPTAVVMEATREALTGAAQRAAREERRRARTALLTVDLDAAFQAAREAGVAEDRPWQRAYADRVLRSFSDGGALALEAGTGTGKTLGYLLAGFEHVAGGPGRRLIVATSTTALRDQVRGEADRLAALPRYKGVRVATYAALQSYVCERGVPALVGDFLSGDEGRGLAAGRDLSYALVNRAEAPPERSRGAACDTARCPLTCPALVRRRAAKDADVVVMTHVALARIAHPDGRSSRSWACWRAGALCVVDEADLFPDAARAALRRAVSVRRLWWLAGRGGGLAAPTAADRSAAVLDGLRAIEELTDPADFPRKRWAALSRVAEVKRTLLGLRAELVDIERDLRGERRRERAASGKTERWRELGEASGLVGREADGLGHVLDGLGTHEWLHTVERAGGALAFSREPYLLRALPGGPLPDFPSVLYTSATLGVGPSSAIAADLGGLGAEDVERVGSPYDLDAWVRAVVVGDLPAYQFGETAARSAERLAAVARAVANVARALGGRTLVLCTSKAERDDVAGRVRGELWESGIGVVVQGEDGAVERFRQDEGHVLLGVDTFWTGLDVPGRALSAVVVPRLPFPSPESPGVWQTKEHDWRRLEALFEGRVALRLRQALGRVVRAPTDRGLFVCLDGRLLKPKYADVRRAVHPDLGEVGVDGVRGWSVHEAERLGLAGSGS